MKLFYRILILLTLLTPITLAGNGTILGVNVTYIQNGSPKSKFIDKTDPFTVIYIDPGSTLSIDVWRDGGSNPPYLFSVFNQTTNYYNDNSNNGVNYVFNIPSGNRIGRWSAGVDNDFFDFRVYQQIALSLPPNNSNQPGTSVIFAYISSSDVSSHWLQIDDNSNFSSLFFNEDVGNFVGVSIPGFPNNGKTFYWRVRGKYNGVWGHTLTLGVL